MSWNIYIYAESKKENSSEWKPLCDGPVCDNFKYYDDGFYDSLNIITSDKLSYPHLKNHTDNYSHIKCCNLNDFMNHLNNEIDKSNAIFLSLCSALGVNVISDEDDDFQISDNNIKPNDIFNKLTFPVNKQFIELYVNQLNQYIKNIEMIGMCNTLMSMCDYNYEIRLLFIHE